MYRLGLECYFCLGLKSFDCLDSCNINVYSIPETHPVRPDFYLMYIIGFLFILLNMLKVSILDFSVLWTSSRVS